MMVTDVTEKWVSAAPFIEAVLASVLTALNDGVPPERLADYLRDMASDLDERAANQRRGKHHQKG